MLSRYERITMSGMGISHKALTSYITPWYKRVNGIYWCTKNYVYFLTFYGEVKHWSKVNDQT